MGDEEVGSSRLHQAQPGKALTEISDEHQQLVYQQQYPEHDEGNLYYADHGFVPPNHGMPTAPGRNEYYVRQAHPGRDATLGAMYHPMHVAGAGPHHVAYTDRRSQHPSSPETSTSASHHTADMLHTWQNQHQALTAGQPEVSPTASRSSFPHLTLPPDPSQYQSTAPGLVDAEAPQGLYHESEGGRLPLLTYAPALPPNAHTLSLETEGLGLLGSGSDTSSRPSPLYSATDGTMPPWYIERQYHADFPESDRPGGMPGYGAFGQSRYQPHTNLHLPEDYARQFLPEGPQTPDVLASTFYDRMSRVPSGRTSYPHSPIDGTSVFAPVPPQSWASFEDGSLAESPAIQPIVRMEDPLDYFQQMPTASHPPHSAPLLGHSVSRDAPIFSTPAVPTISLPPPPRGAKPTSAGPSGSTPSAALPATAASTSASGGPSAKKQAQKTGQGKRENRQYDGLCSNCGSQFGVLSLRGYESDYKDPFTFSYLCLQCAPSNVSLPSGSNSTGSTPPESATGSAEKRKDKPASKKRIRNNDSGGAATCDVCMRTVAHGGPVPDDGRADLTFNLELVCNRCTGRYARCSDCGGGGGVRLGVGKWRCKELFTPPRKTCNLSHARQSSVASMEYAIIRINDIPSADMPVIVEQCKQVFESALYSSLAVPEVLERGVTNASTFADIQSKVETGWAEAHAFIDQDVEHTLGFRRYLGVRWAAPKPRKSASKRTSVAAAGFAPGISDMPEMPSPVIDSSSILRPGKKLSGYVTGEWDIYGGTFYISVSVPYSTGESYEGSAYLINMMTKRVQDEREELLEGLFRSGQTHDMHRIRHIEHCFTMLFFAPESKLVSYLESKRQLLPLERYLSMYPDADPTVFPPYRPVAENIATEPGWNCLVRRVAPVVSSLPDPPTRKGSTKSRK